jgi:cytidine deaminase
MEEEIKKKLIDLALQARQWAYVPYSHYAVGTALVTSSGRIYDGVNVENSSFPNGCCAERVAIYKAVSEGERQFEMIVVATENGGSSCGMCRQVMAEFGLDTRVILVDGTGKIREETTVAKMLPGAFTPKDLL